MRMSSGLCLFLACVTLAACHASGLPKPTQSARTTSAPAIPSVHPDSPQGMTDAEERLVSQGYRVEVHGGEKVFCRREVVVGSHFEKKVCGTVAQLAASRQTSREVTESTQRYGTNPTGH